MTPDDNTPSDDGAAPAPAPRPPRRRPRGRHVAISFSGFALKVLVLLALLIGALWWLLATPQGTAWLLARSPAQVVGTKGALLGEFSAESLTMDLPGEGGRLQIDGLSWRGLRFASAPWPLWFRVWLPTLHATRVDVHTGASTDSTLSAPADLRLPLQLDIDDLRIGVLQVDSLGETPLRDIRAAVHVGADKGAAHRIDGLKLEWDRIRASGHAEIGSAAALPVSAQLRLEQTLADGGTWEADAALSGPLAAARLVVQLRARAQTDAAEQSLHAQATLHPFAAWPLGELSATAKALDLAALSSAAPTTRLDIEARVESSGLDRPAHASIRLRNDQAGRWNEGRLPLRSATLELSARPDEPQHFDLRQLDASLGSQHGEAGRLRGSGEWNAGQWQLDARIDGLAPQALDARAPAMTMGGQLALRGSGFDVATLDKAKVDARGQLQGRQLDGGQPAAAPQVQLQLQASASLLRIELVQALARAGDASAQLSGTLTRRSTDAPWRIDAKTRLRDFDPRPWWPGDSDSAWRRGPHRLNANADVAVQLPADLGNGGLQAVLQGLRGQVQIGIEPSRLAGVPLSGSLAVQADGAAPARLTAQLEADGNRLRAEASVSAKGPGTDDHWTVQVEAPKLQRLQPIWRLLGGTGALAGAFDVDASAAGRWPRLSSQGRLKASALRIDQGSVQQATASWHLGSRADDAFEAQLDLSELAYAQASAATLGLKLSGLVRDHRLDLRIDSKTLPPAWAETLRAAPGSAGAKRTLAHLLASGGFSGSRAGTPTGWHGSVQQIEVRGDVAGAAAWLTTQDVQIALQWADGPLQLDIGQGRADLLGAGLRFGPIRWRAAQGTAAAQLQAQAQLEPLPVAPLLKRLQPDFGWGGDLQLRGHLQVSSMPQFSADVILERDSGDLSVSDGSGTRALGLSDLRVALTAEQGTWSFSGGLAGKTLGTAAGALVIQASPQALWPAGSAPMQGVLDLRVGDLGVWGPWLPPGWRLSGDMHVAAGIAGQFGAPEITGEVVGTSIGVRNVLQGVEVHSGDVSIALKGDSARIERFTAEAGKGRLTLSGDASLGAAPRADLQLKLDQFQLLGRVDRRIVTSGAAQLRLGKDSVALDGELKVDEGLIDFSRSDAPAVSSDVQVQRAGAKPVDASTTADAGTPANAERKIDLNLRVLLGDKLRLRGQGLDAELRGDLRLTAPRGKLRVDGTVRAVNGTYKAYRQNLVIDRGVITFNGPVENPQLDIEATRPNLDVRVGVAVTGTVLLPRIRLFSDPPMSDVEKLSWLLRGRASEGNGSADTALLQAAAMALASGDEPGAFDNVLNAIGLDELSVREGGNGGNGTGTGTGAIVAVGKQLSRNWYIGYERSLNAAAGNWQLIYRIAQRFTVRAQSGAENSLSLIWTWRWQ